MSAPLSRILEDDTAPVATAASGTEVIGQAPFKGTVAKVEYIPSAAITGANTNTRAFRLVNLGQAGAGSTLAASLQADAGVNFTANDEKVITLSGTAANLVVAEGDTLQWQSNAVGTGIADPGGTVRVTLARGDVSS